jgi:regulatory protein
VDNDAAHTEAIRMLARRELSAEGVRARLHDRGFDRADVERAIVRLLDSGALDDDRVARAYARTAATVKGRGRLRVMRELLQMGIASDVAARALGDVYGDLDERTLVADAIRKKTRGRTRPTTPGEYARLYQHLMRQGFSPAVVAAALRRLRPGSGSDAGGGE